MESRTKPHEGVRVSIILFISSVMRSEDTILIRSHEASMAVNVSSDIWNPRRVAKRMARIMRRGSSEKVRFGSSGVRMRRSSRSSRPSKGSNSRP